MKLSAVAPFAVLLVPFLFLEEASGHLAGEKQAAQEPSASSARGKKTPEASFPEDVGRGVRRQPAAGVWKTGRTGTQEGIPSQGLSQAQLGVKKLTAGRKKPSPQSPPPKRKSQRQQNHSKSHGKFNTDTYSCFGIQSKTCKRPSDCDGCLGLYTCKLPRGKCDLKAVSQKTGGFSQSIQNR